MLQADRNTPAVLDAIAAEATQLLQSRTTHVLNAIDDGIFCLGHDGNCIFVNEAAVRMLGFTNREMLGRSMH
jgi:PAS domain-containing protein